MSVPFGDDYSALYDLFAAKKDYAREVAYVSALVESWGFSFHGTSPIIDMACGSGRHLQAFPQTHKKFGVDRSAPMISQARQCLGNSAELLCSDVQKVSYSEVADLTISLFHVMSYQTDFSSLVDYFRALKKVTKPTGAIVIDFWHRSAWDLDPPVQRTTEVALGSRLVRRTSTPSIDKLQGIVSLDVEVVVSQDGIQEKKFSESHKMRGFTALELQLLAEITGLELLHLGNWNEADAGLSSEDWIGVGLLRKP